MNEITKPLSSSEAAITLSVVIPTYGEFEKLAKCLSSLEAELKTATFSWEIIVTDDATPGDFPENLKSQFPKINWLSHSERLGFSGNIERGIQKSVGEILFLLNSDMYLEKGFFGTFLNHFQSKDLFALTPMIKEPNDSNGSLKKLKISFQKAQVQFFNLSDPQSNQPAYIPYANGGGSFFRSQTYHDLGGFDSVFNPYYWEDTDLGYRAWKMGWKIIYDPNIGLKHDHQASIGNEKKQKVQRTKARNQSLFIWRNLTDFSLGTLFFKGILPNLFKSLFKLRFRQLCWQVLNLKYLSTIARFRNHWQSKYKYTDHEVQELLVQSVPHFRDNESSPN